jgi:hypothetical protein
MESAMLSLGFLRSSDAWVGLTPGLRFSVLLLILSVVGLVEAVLLSSFGFGWFVIVLAIMLYGVKKFAPRMLGNATLMVPYEQEINNQKRLKQTYDSDKK